MTTIRVILVDDTRMFRDGLRLVIDLEEDMTVVGVASDGAEGVELALVEQPDVVLMDIRMPNMDGVEATRRFIQALPQTHVIVCTTYSDDDYIFDALKAGAVGYLLKDMPATELINAIRAAQEGGVLIPPAIAARLVAEYSRLAQGGPPAEPQAPLRTESTRVETAPSLPADTDKHEVNPRVADLTPREREILQLLADGLSNKEIAEKLFLSEGTVKNYVSATFSKLHARDRAQAVSFAIRQGLVN